MLMNILLAMVAANVAMLLFNCVGFAYDAATNFRSKNLPPPWWAYAIGWCGCFVLALRALS